MNIRHLKIFITVADCGKMSEAAEKLFISQPSVSQAIKEIEYYYGVKLFERLSKKLYITKSGELLLRYARHIVDAFDEMELDLKNSGENICLHIGATVTVGTCMLNEIINRFEEENKDVSTKIVVNNTNVIENMLLHSDLDIGIVEGRVDNKDLVKIPIYNDRLVLVAGKNHEFYYKDEINIEDLTGQDMIFREEGSGARESFDLILEENNISVNKKWNSTNTEAIKNAVIGGQGLGILSTLIIENELKNDTLHIVPIKNIDILREICIVYHKDKFISDHLKKLIECIKCLKKEF